MASNTRPLHPPTVSEGPLCIRSLVRGLDRFGINYVSLVEIRAALTRSGIADRRQQDTALIREARLNRIRLGAMQPQLDFTPDECAAAIRVGDELFGFAGIVQEG